MTKVTTYIQEHWEKTIHQPKEAGRGIIKMPNAFSVPCANEKDLFSDFYYWDTYFANLGFLLDDHVDQAENNLDVMAYFIRNLGYVPNADYIIDRSQPPLFTRGVWDLYQVKKDPAVLEKYIGEIIREYTFFQYDRNTKIGLNQFSSELNRSGAMRYYKEFSERVGEFCDTTDGQIDLVKNMMAIAESGWDFTPRFETEQKRFATLDFVHLDLNCLLYDIEQKISAMQEVLGKTEEADRYRRLAEERKEKMQRYLQDPKSGIFYDYNYKDKKLSKVLSCASFYPFAVGISDDKEAAKAVLARLEFEHGLAACEYRGEDADYLQWDYPCMWPSNVYFAYVGLKRIGLLKEADRIAKKYLRTVENCFLQSGALWEKYDVTKGSVAVAKEYETPEMMGWTAGVYRFLEKEGQDR